MGIGEEPVGSADIGSRWHTLGSIINRASGPDPLPRLMGSAAVHSPCGVRPDTQKRSPIPLCLVPKAQS